MVNYCAKFIQNISSLTSPLREIIKNKEWEWKPKHQKAFEDIRSSLSKNALLSYYDTTKQTQLLVDASPHGLGALLT